MSNSNGRARSDDIPLPPHNLEAEQAILGAAFWGDSTENALQLQDHWFFDTPNRKLAAAIRGLAQSGIIPEIVALRDALTSSGKLTEVGEWDHLLTCHQAGANKQGFDGWRAVLTKLAEQRVLIRIGARIQIEATEDRTRGLCALGLGMREWEDLSALSVKKKAPELEGISIMDFDLADPGDGTELLKHRLLCRHSGMLLVGSTGVGKSSLSLQATFSWALGWDFFGIQPTGPLKSLIIQSENDDGDMAEARDGVLRGMNLSEEHRELLRAQVFVFRETEHTREEFVKLVLRPLLAKHRPDLVWIDPVLAFLGGDSSSQTDVGEFLRNGIAPLLREFDCGCILVHHTNKPASGKDRAAWAAGDFAYLGGGSAEWANWPRAVLAIRSVGSSTEFELRAGKRGGRIGWKDADGNRLYHRMISYTKGDFIFWRLMNDSDVKTEQRNGRPPINVVGMNLHEFISACLPQGEGMNVIAARLEQWLADERKIDIGRSTCKQKIRELLECGKLSKGGCGYISGPNK